MKRSFLSGTCGRILIAVGKQLVSSSSEKIESIIPGGLFPLPLSDFEYYMLMDDRPSHPMVFVMVIHVSGPLSEQPFRESLTELQTAHVLLRCRVTRVSGKGWCWVPLESAGEIVEWQTVDDSAAANFVPSVKSLDVHHQAGIHVNVLAAADRAMVVMYLHHACCDGIGALQLVGELFARYGQKTAAPEAKRPEFEPPESAVLLQRENYDTGEAASLRQKKSLRRIIGKVSRLLLRAPIKLARTMDFRQAEATQNQRRLRIIQEPNPAAIQSRVLSKSIHRSLRAVATRFDVSINDLFIREMMLQIRDWNRRAGVRFGRRWIRLAVPLSMRTRQHDRMPAANVVSYALVTRREADCEDPIALLKSIHQQTSDVLYHREGIVCLKLFRVLRKIPGAMRMFLSFKTVLSTVVLANVGDVRRRFDGRFPMQQGRWVAGNVIIEQIRGVAPVRTNTRAAMSIGDYAGDVIISLRTDGLELNAEDSERFLTEFIDRLKALAADVVNVENEADEQ